MAKSVTSQCRYALLTSALQRDIKQGRYKIGTALPTEAELCEQFGVSRHTVREALRQLKEMGLIASRQGLGSVVQAATPAPRYVESLDSPEDFWEFLRQARAELLVCDMAVLPVPLMKMCGLPDNQRQWLHIRMLRHWGDKDLPTLLTDTYIDAKYGGIKDQYNPKCSLTKLLEKNYGVTSSVIEQTIQAIVLDKPLSELLQTKLKAPALQTIRRCLTASGEVLFISCNIAPAERYTYTTKMRVTSR